MTDRQKRIIAALQSVFPYAKVRYRARHILANIKLETKEGTIPRRYYWVAVRAAIKGAHKDPMHKIKAINEKGWGSLENVPKYFWARFAFHTYVKAAHDTNNMMETWNSSLGNIRG